jgi:polygalacturonase
MKHRNRYIQLTSLIITAACFTALACGGGNGEEADGAEDTTLPDGVDGSDDTGGDDAAPDPAADPAEDPADVIPDPTVDDAGPDIPPPPATCEPLPAPTGPVINVGPSQAGELRSIVNDAASGTTIMLEDGTYMMNGGDSTHRLQFSTPGLTLRSASGNREAVILDADYSTDEIISIYASNTTLADITLARAYNHPIHASGNSSGNIEGVLIHNVHIIDPGQQAVKVNASYDLTYVDSSVLECSLIELTDAGRPHIRDNCYTGGLDAHAAWGWIVRNNIFRGFWCESGLSEHGVHMWRTCRDTLVESNVFIDCARGIGFGMGEGGTGDDRVYDDNPYPSVGYMGHIDGIMRNNFIFAGISGFDAGITLEQAHGSVVVHNTVVSTVEPFSSIEWRWDNTDVRILNNLVSHNLRDRGGSAELVTNIENAELAWFEDPSAGDLHLTTAASAAVDAGTPLEAGLCDTDIDGDARDSSPDIGADEVP